LFPGSKLRSGLWTGAICGFLAVGSWTQERDAKVSFDSSETLFSMVAAINSCGYDTDLAASNRLRATVRAEMAANVASGQAEAAQRELCAFYRDHQQPDAAHELAQYVSLALVMGPPPGFELKMKEADLPPDAGFVVGVGAPLQVFYQRAGLHALWEKHQTEYQALLDQYHEQIVRQIQSTDSYLRLPIGSYHARRMAMLLEPMAAPSAVNARTYASDYYLVLSPDSAGRIRLEAVRHIYLHYVLDSMVQSRPVAMKRLEAILPAVMASPMDDAYKRDMPLLVTESLIRAIEARMLQDGKASEEARTRVVDNAVADGFVLTRSLYTQLLKFEKEPSGFKDFLPEMLAAIDAAQEKKRAEQVTFSARATPDVLSAVPKQEPELLERAEARLTVGDRRGAQELAQQALQEKQGDAARALFILAKAAPKIGVAQEYFERALEVGKNPRVVAWSHVYLGRIHDLMEERDEALKHYNAALNSGYDGPEMKTAAESGIKEPYRAADLSQPAKPQ